MQKRHLFSFFMILVFLPSCFAQTKRALIVGVNDYYFRDTKTNQILRDPNNSLKGCVNDAKSVKELIISRFGFKPEGIKELYSAQATKKNILEELDNLLSVSKPGDNAFFFYSGHGLQMPNASGNSTDEAIAPTDVLYQKNGFILSLQLAAIFNKFVDKKVTLTTIFDCCHSWGTRTVVVKQDDTYVTKKISNVGSGPNIGLQYNIGGGGNNEAMDFEILELPELNEGEDTTTEIRELNLDDFQLYTENLTDTVYAPNKVDEKFLAGINKDNGAAIESKLLGGSAAIPVGPAKRVNSNFLFLSATDDDQKAIEKWDENLNKHGVFTKALIEVFKKNPATITSQQVFDKIKAELKKRNYTETPTLRSAPERKINNLLSVSPITIKNDVFTKCIAAGDGTITLDKGAQSGILKGNILQDISNPAVKVEVQSQSGENNAVAETANGKALIGHTFKVASWYVKSAPLLKVFLPKDNFTISQLSTFFNVKLKALVNEQSVTGKYSGSGNCLPFEKSGRCSKIYVTAKDITYINSKTHEIKSIPDINKTTIQSVIANTAYFVYLPIPAEWCTALEVLCKKDQNIQLVDDPALADVSFYCAYTQTITENKDITDKPSKPVEENNLSLLDYMTQNSLGNSYQFPQLNQPIASKKNDYNLVLAFSKETVGAEQKANSHSSLAPFIFIKNGTVLSANVVANKMYSWLVYTASKRGVWLNGWAKK